MAKKFKHRFYSKELLFGSVKLTMNTDPDKYKYRGYGIGFDSCSEFPFTGGNWEEMSLFLELIWAHLCILMIREKTS